MSNLKRKIINIVNGIPDAHIPEAVELSSDQMVATVPDGHTKESVNQVINSLGPCDGSKVVVNTPYKPYELGGGFGSEWGGSEQFAIGGEIPAGTSYLVGDSSCGCAITAPTELVQDVDQKPDGSGGKMFHIDTKGESVTTELRPWQQEMIANMKAAAPKKPFLKFRMVTHPAYDNRQIEPRYANSMGDSLFSEYCAAIERNQGPRVTL